MSDRAAASTIASALRRSLESAERAWKGGERAHAYGYITQAVEQALRELAVIDQSDQEEESRPRAAEGASLQLASHGVHSISDEEADRIADEVVGPVLSSHVQRSYPAGPARLAKRFPIHPVKGGRRG